MLLRNGFTFFSLTATPFVLPVITAAPSLPKPTVFCLHTSHSQVVYYSLSHCICSTIWDLGVEQKMTFWLKIVE